MLTKYIIKSLLSYFENMQILRVLHELFYLLLIIISSSFFIKNTILIIKLF